MTHFYYFIQFHQFRIFSLFGFRTHLYYQSSVFHLFIDVFRVLKTDFLRNKKPSKMKRINVTGVLLYQMTELIDDHDFEFEDKHNSNENSLKNRNFGNNPSFGSQNHLAGSNFLQTQQSSKNISQNILQNIQNIYPQQSHPQHLKPGMHQHHHPGSQYTSNNSLARKSGITRASPLSNKPKTISEICPSELNQENIFQNAITITSHSFSGGSSSSISDNPAPPLTLIVSAINSPKFIGICVYFLEASGSTNKKNHVNCKSQPASRRKKWNSGRDSEVNSVSYGTLKSSTFENSVLGNSMLGNSVLGHSMFGNSVVDGNATGGNSRIETQNSSRNSFSKQSFSRTSVSQKRSPNMHNSVGYSKRLIKIPHLAENDVLTCVTTGKFLSKNENCIAVAAVSGKVFVIQVSDVVDAYKRQAISSTVPTPSSLNTVTPPLNTFPLNTASLNPGVSGQTFVKPSSNTFLDCQWHFSENTKTSIPTDKTGNSIKMTTDNYFTWLTNIIHLRAIPCRNYSRDYMLAIHSDKTISMFQLESKIAMTATLELKCTNFRKFHVHEGFTAASSTFSYGLQDSTRVCEDVLIGGNGSSFMVIPNDVQSDGNKDDQLDQKTVEYFIDKTETKYTNPSSRICTLGSIQLLIEFTGLIWRIENRKKSKLIQLEHEVFDICKIHFNDRHYLIAVACDGCVSIVDLSNVDDEKDITDRIHGKDTKASKVEVYLFDLGMNVRSSGCGSFFKLNEFNEFVEQNILVLVTFQGRYLVFDLEQLLMDKLLVAESEFT